MSSSFSGSAFSDSLLWTAGAIVVVLAGTGIAAKVAGKHSVIDTAWGVMFAAVAGTSFWRSDEHGNDARRWVLLTLTVVWGVRLAWHIGVRSIGKGEDPRYAAMLHDRSPLFAIGMVYVLQGVLAFAVSMSVQVGMFERGSFNAVAYVGMVVWLVGVLFEGIGDWQLEQFKADPVNKGTVMDRGLWRYTRHPNYFGDACVWLGIFIVSASCWPGVLTFASPAIMVYLLAFGSGKKVLEKAMANRPGYSEYMKRTSGFIPLPPRRR